MIGADIKHVLNIARAICYALFLNSDRRRFSKWMTVFVLVPILGRRPGPNTTVSKNDLPRHHEVCKHITEDTRIELLTVALIARHAIFLMLLLVSSQD